MVNFLEAVPVPMVLIYLMDVWETGITYAAGLINIWVGTTKVLPLIFLFLLDNYISSYWMLIFSTTASALGMALMSISTPSWPYRLITGSCSEYKMKCVSEMQQSFFYLALVLIMIGRSSSDATMETMNYKGDANEQKSTREIVTSGGDYIALQAGVLLLAPWSIIFGISSVYSSMALFHSMGKSWSHKLYIDKPETSQVTTILRVFVASISNISQKLPYGSASFSNKIKIDDSPLHCSSTLRFLEKAAIRPPIGYKRQSRWTLCSLQEVEITKTVVRMFRMGVVFVILVLLSSIGNTYFIAQAKYLKPTVIFGIEVINLKNLINMYISTKVQHQEESRKIIKNNDENKEVLHKAVTDAMIYAIICYSIAALVEKSRLGVIRLHGISNNSGEIIPMSMFWLFPQFLFLGFVDASLELVIHFFLADEISLPIKNFKMFMVEAFTGVGHMSSVLVAYIVGKVSENGGRINWFQHYTENSRLDLFYWSLTALCLVVLIIWFLVSYYFNKSRSISSVRAVLCLARIIERLALILMIIYLTDVWETGIMYAAGLLNIWVGNTHILSLVFLFLLDNYISSYWMLIFSTISSALGMGLMSISTPSWLYRLIIGSCSEYKMKCISETQQSFFYLALVLIMIGRSSYSATIKTINYKSDVNELMTMRLNVPFRGLVTFGGDYIAVQAGFLLLAPWSIIFGISSVCSSIALFYLMGKSWSHKLYIDKPETSQVTSILSLWGLYFKNMSRTPLRFGWFLPENNNCKDVTDGGCLRYPYPIKFNREQLFF
ncbi:protein NRT1/ PTR FAMILY 5.5-like [Rutidosis leptorrhynchoides]|uniref:protein NRT1/ PTR FAMILY 5.5-like n=1 Tax=Rutidosis leptorrhynchoides TaxID=125765 RepID=UPI003A99EA70